MTTLVHRRLLLAVLLVGAATPLRAQISFTSAVDLALRNSPKVRSAQAQVDHARAEVSDVRDIYIPSVNGGAAVGEAFGYSPYPPTLFTVNASSLIFNDAQRDYIRSARAGLASAQLALQDAREGVAEDAALTFVALDHDQQREEVLTQQHGDAQHLVSIVQERHTAGYDTDLDLIDARLREKQLYVSLLQAQEDTANDGAHLGALIGTPAIAVHAAGGFPDQSFPAIDTLSIQQGQTPAIAAAFAAARAKQYQAFGDKRFLFRPQVSFFVQYNHYATFTDTFKSQRELYQSLGQSLSSDNEAVGVQITIPLLDRARSDRARETAADAVKALADAQNTQMQIFDTQNKLSHSLTMLQARGEVAALEQQRAQQQLAIVRAQLTAAPTGNGPAITPKDEQNALIDEREKYLSVVDTTFQLRQAEISILRQTGRLQAWITSTLTSTPTPTLPAAPTPSAPVPTH